MKKYVIQVRASINDEPYSSKLIQLEKDGRNVEVSMPEYFKAKGISTLREDLIISCHGNTPLTIKYASDLERLYENGYKMVVLASGGLSFQLPSILAANMPSVPVISVPTNAGSYGGLEAFLAAELPSGTSAISTTGVEDFETGARSAESILNNDYSSVSIYKGNDKLFQSLENYEIPAIEADGQDGGLSIGVLDLLREDFQRFDDQAGIGLYTVHADTAYDAVLLADLAKNMRNSIYIRGEHNLATFAAKIMSGSSDRLKKQLRELRKIKADSYADRDLVLEIWGDN